MILCWQLSRCHQFTEQDEMQRVISAGGAVHRSKGASDKGPLRAYFPGELYPGYTRALMHLYTPCLVIIVEVVDCSVQPYGLAVSR